MDHNAWIMLKLNFKVVRKMSKVSDQNFDVHLNGFNPFVRLTCKSSFEMCTN